MNNPTSTRRAFFRHSTALAAGLSLVSNRSFAAETNAPSGNASAADTTTKLPNNFASMVEADGRLRFDFGPEQMVLPGGLQPFMFVTSSGALVLQSQAPTPPVATKRMHYPWAMATVISRDNAATWTAIPLKPGENGLNLEGGGLQLRDGTIIGLDTYVTPGKNPGEGLGQLYVSKDDWQTVQGPEENYFDLPNINFYASKDDGGHPHDAVRLHRRVIELPNGDLLTTIYGAMNGDNTPSTYMPSMMKSRVLLVRSSDKGRHWKFISTVAVDPKVGTEGFGEPALTRISQGDAAGRLLCFMRTGRELYEAFSDDEGKTWSKPAARTFAGLDINRTELWVDMFRKFKGRKGKPLDENNPDDLRGAVVDPDLIELRNGLLATTFGVRVPQKACWPHYEHPWNGNYLAVSQDHGKTWPNVVRLTSGIPTTHYTGLVETKNDNELFVVYDFGFWGRKERYTYGRKVNVTVKQT